MLAVSVLTTAAWFAAGAVMSGRGLDVTDEGFYLLSYRWWDSNPANFTAVQYVWGPVFSAIGHDVAVIRLLRTAAVLLAHLGLGLAAARWTVALPGNPAGRPGRATVVLAVVASGGIVQGWGPLTPGYNDTGLLATVLLVAASLSLHTAHLVNRRPSLVWPVVCGPVVLVLGLAKWSTAVLVVPFLAVVLVAAHRGSRGRLVGVGLAFVLSLVTSTFLFHLLVVPWSDVVDGLVPVTRSISAGTNSPVVLLGTYTTSTARIALAAALPVLLACGLALLLRRLRPRMRSCSTMAAPMLALALTAGLAGGFVGGVDGAFWYTAALVAVCLSTWLLARGHGTVRSARRGIVPVVVMLIVVPALQAAGTGNPLYFLAVAGVSTWVVLLLALWSRAREPAAALAAASGVVACLLVIGWVGSTGPLLNPYRSTPVYAVTTSFSSGSTGRLALDPQLVDIVDRLRPVVGPPGTPMMAFDEMAGLVLLLDGRSIGEAWYSRADPARTAAGIVRYCNDTSAPWADELPVIVSDRELGPTEEAALAACGLDTTTDFRPMRVSGTYDLNVLVPREPAGD